MVNSAPILYYAQAADTLRVVAVRFGVKPTEISSPEPIIETTFINPGQLLIIPRSLSNTTSSQHILPDSEVVFSPSAVNFNIQDFADQSGGYLSSLSMNGTRAQAINPAPISFCALPWKTRSTRACCWPCWNTTVTGSMGVLESGPDRLPVRPYSALSQRAIQPVGLGGQPALDRLLRLPRRSPDRDPFLRRRDHPPGARSKRRHRRFAVLFRPALRQPPLAGGAGCEQRFPRHAHLRCLATPGSAPAPWSRFTQKGLPSRR